MVSLLLKGPVVGRTAKQHRGVVCEPDVVLRRGDSVARCRCGIGEVIVADGGFVGSEARDGVPLLQLRRHFA